MADDPPAAAMPQLAAAGVTRRGSQVLVLIASGLSNRAIAEGLSLSERGVEKHITTLYQKLGIPVDSRIHRRIRLVLIYQQLTAPR